MSWTHIKYLDVEFYTPISYGNRTHKICQLPNGILTLLISDPTESTIGCSLTVAAGSHDDPDDIPGLAHLCEHMLLAGGSKKYPISGLYHDIVAKNNGSHNAFTTGDQTTFYFELPDFHHSTEANFEKVVDIFASFFSEPLFDRSSINKEIYAIQNEHDSNVSNTVKILYHATRLLSNHNHPFSRFATGCISTLKARTQLNGSNLKGSLYRFFRSHYAGSKMTLCIRGPQSVHGLAKLALSKFSSIPSISGDQKGLPFKQIKGFSLLRDARAPKRADLCCFPDDWTLNTILIRSAKPPVARFLFPVWQRKTMFTASDFAIYPQFWLELFGDESPGSLSYYLSQKGWITSCYAYTSDFSLDNTGLILELSLTNSGWQNVDFIAQLIAFSMIPAFSRKNTIQLARFLSEQLSIDMIKFLFSTIENSPMEECSQLSGVMQRDLQASELPYIFKGSPILTEELPAVGLFNEGRSSEEWWLGQAIKFQSYLKEFMSLFKMRIILSGPPRNCPLFDPKMHDADGKVDEFYGFEYFKFKYELKRPVSDLVPSNTFHIPFENKFRPEFSKSLLSLRNELRNSVTRSKEASLAFSVRRHQLDSLPHLVGQNEVYDMWVLNEASSLACQSFVTFELANMKIESSPESTINLDVLAQIISATLSSELYPAVKLGFSLQIFPSIKGDVRLRFTISGFSERMMRIVKAVTDVMKRITNDSAYPSKELLRSARVLVRKKYEQAASENSAKLAGLGLLIVTERYMWTLEDRIEAIENTDMKSFKQFISEFMREPINLTLFIQGDLSCADDINHYLDRELTHHLRANIKEAHYKREILYTKLLAPGTNVYFDYAGQKDDPTNSIVYFIQTGLRRDKKIYTLTMLCDYLMSFTLVPELRNRRQIGYMVLGGLRLLSDTVGLHFTVMSSAPSSILEDSINQYLIYLEIQVLNTMTEHAFQKKIIENFLQILKKDGLNKLQKYSGPASLLDELTANIEQGDSKTIQSHSMKTHKKLMNQILSGFTDFSDCGGHIDKNLLQRLTLAEFKAFFEQKISIRSNVRSKLSILVGSPMSGEQIANRAIFLQLQSLFKLHGLVIESDKLQAIVESSNRKPAALTKELCRYFHSRHDTWRLCSLILREAIKMLTTNVRLKQDRETAMAKGNQKYTPAINLKYIDDINVYKREHAMT